LLLLASVPVDAGLISGPKIPSGTSKNIDRLGQAMEDAITLKKNREKLQKSIDQRHLKLLALESERKFQANEIRYEKRKKKEEQSALDTKRVYIEKLYRKLRKDRERESDMEVARAIHNALVKIAKKDPLIAAPIVRKLEPTNLELSEVGSSHGHHSRGRSHVEPPRSSSSQQASSRRSRRDQD